MSNQFQPPMFASASAQGQVGYMRRRVIIMINLDTSKYDVWFCSLYKFIPHSFLRVSFPPVVSKQSDDFDLNEIFADYFINEFEDPHNAYTNAMANYAAPPSTLGQRQPVQQSLPSSGIRTAYHAASSAPMPQQNYQQQQQQTTTTNAAT